MAEKFESAFHKWYVRGEGEVEEKSINLISPITECRKAITLEEVEAEYRRYLRDSEAQLPQEIMKTFLAYSASRANLINTEVIPILEGAKEGKGSLT